MSRPTMGHTTRRALDADFHVVPVDGDGTCMFHAVGALTNEDGHALRRRVAAYARSREGARRLRPFVDDSITMEEYARGILLGEWGTELELNVLAALKGIRIRVYDVHAHDDVRVVVYNAGVHSAGESPTVNVVRTNGNHYDALVPRAALGEVCHRASDCAGTTNLCFRPEGSDAGTCVEEDVWKQLYAMAPGRPEPRRPAGAQRRPAAAQRRPAAAQRRPAAAQRSRPEPRGFGEVCQRADDCGPDLICDTVGHRCVDTTTYHLLAEDRAAARREPRAAARREPRAAARDAVVREAEWARAQQLAREADRVLRSQQRASAGPAAAMFNLSTTGFPVMEAW